MAAQPGLCRTWSAMFVVQHQWRMKSTSCLNVQHTAEREKIFFLKSNKLNDKNYFNSNFKSQNVFQLYYLFNSKKVTVLKIFVKYIWSITDIRSRLM